MMIFETERLIVRQYMPGEKENFFLLNGNEEVMRYIRPVKTKDESNEFLEEVINSYPENIHMGRWAVDEKSTSAYVGSFAIIQMLEEPEKIQLGYALLKEHWGKGFATELTAAGIKFAFDVMDLKVINAVTEPLNISSQKVLLKTGFKKEGTIIEKGKELLLFSIKQTDRSFT